MQELVFNAEIAEKKEKNCMNLFEKGVAKRILRENMVLTSKCRCCSSTDKKKKILT